MRLPQKSFGGIRRQRMLFETPIPLILLRKINGIGVSKNFVGLCKKPLSCHLAACAAK
jgi:hypothetical protein